MTSSTKEMTITDQQVVIPRLYKVIMHDDDTTSFEFVVSLLMSVFHKTDDQANMLTREVHTKGNATVAIYTKEIASQKVYESTKMATMAGFKFKVTMEVD